MKLNPDGTGTIVTGAQENGTGAVMAMPTYVAEELGMRAGGLLDPYQDTDAAPWDMGSCGSQTTFNSGRAVIAAARRRPRAAARRRRGGARGSREDLELADGAVRVKGSPGQVGHDREHRRRRQAVPRQGRRRGARVPAESESQPKGCVGRLGLESFLAPQLIAHAAHVKVDRETGVVRVLRVAAAHDSGMILNRIGADGQVYGGVVMGIGQALSEGTQLDEDGRQRNPHLLDYKLVTSADAPRDRHRLDRDRHAERRAEGLQGRRRAAVRPDGRRGRERDRRR